MDEQSGESEEEDKWKVSSPPLNPPFYASVLAFFLPYLLTVIYFIHHSKLNMEGIKIMSSSEQ